MDSSQLFCAFLISIMLSLFVKSLIFPEKKPRPMGNSHLDKKLRSEMNSQIQRPETPKKPELPEVHEVEELRHLTLLELQNFNHQLGKLTDRYWREIFRRQNDAHHPDHINVSRLQTANIITALDEHLPHGAIKEVTITGLVPKPFSSRKCEVMRYLRDRLSNSPDVELSFTGDHLRISAPQEL